jgi:hypothetical protein
MLRPLRGSNPAHGCIRSCLCCARSTGARLETLARGHVFLIFPHNAIARRCQLDSGGRTHEQRPRSAVLCEAVQGIPFCEWERWQSCAALPHAEADRSPEKMHRENLDYMLNRLDESIGPNYGSARSTYAKDRPINFVREGRAGSFASSTFAAVASGAHSVCPSRTNHVVRSSCSWCTNTEPHNDRTKITSPLHHYDEAAPHS